MDLREIKVDLPKSWQEISRFGHENQVSIKIYHINPVSLVDPKIFEVPKYANDPNVTITKVDPPKVNLPLSDFFDGMSAAIAAGIVPASFNPTLDTLRQGMNENYHPEDGDLNLNITIARYVDAEIAKQSLKNTLLMPTQGFDIPIPGGVGIPGASKDITFQDLFTNEAYQEHLSPHIPAEQLKKIREVMAKVDKEMKERVKPNLEQSGGQYREGKYLGQDVTYLEIKNRAPKAKKVSRSKTTGSGGLETLLDPLPKTAKAERGSTIIYQSMLVENFIISGGLLPLSDSLSSGNTPCYSLTKYKREVTSFEENGQTFTNITFIPLISSLAQEGYLHKEELEAVLRGVISTLKSMR